MKPLTGLTILEFSTMITASFAAMMMAEQGARVIKVEPLEGGDPVRYLGTGKGGISALFANCNRGKQSVRIDLKDTRGQALIREMITSAFGLVCLSLAGTVCSVTDDATRLGNPMRKRIGPTAE